VAVLSLMLRRKQSKQRPDGAMLDSLVTRPLVQQRDDPAARLVEGDRKQLILYRMAHRLPSFPFIRGPGFAIMRAGTRHMIALIDAGLLTGCCEQLDHPRF